MVQRLEPAGRRCAPAGLGHRRSPRKNSRMSVVRASGSSSAAKCPPRSRSVQRTMVFSASANRRIATSWAKRRPRCLGWAALARRLLSPYQRGVASDATVCATLSHERSCRLRTGRAGIQGAISAYHSSTGSCNSIAAEALSITIAYAPVQLYQAHLEPAEYAGMSRWCVRHRDRGKLDDRPTLRRGRGCVTLGQRSGGRVIHFPAAVCTSSPSTVPSHVRRVQVGRGGVRWGSALAGLHLIADRGHEFRLANVTNS